MTTWLQCDTIQLTPQRGERSKKLQPKALYFRDHDKPIYRTHPDHSFRKLPIDAQGLLLKVLSWSHPPTHLPSPKGNPFHLVKVTPFFCHILRGKGNNRSYYLSQNNSRTYLTTLRTLQDRNSSLFISPGNYCSQMLLLPVLWLPGFHNFACLDIPSTVQ